MGLLHKLLPSHTMPLAIVITTDQDCKAMKAGLGMQVALKEVGGVAVGLEVVDLAADGQCAKQGVTKGMVLTHLDNKPLSEVLSEVTQEAFSKEVMRRASNDEKSYVMNFDGVAPQAQNTFEKLLASGISIQKKNKHQPYSFDVFKSPFATNWLTGQTSRVLYKDGDTLKIAEKKGDKKSHDIAVANVINVGLSANNNKEVVIESKDKSETQTLKFPSTNAAKTCATKLHRLCSQEQEQSETDSIISRESTTVQMESKSYKEQLKDAAVENAPALKEAALENTTTALKESVQAP